MKKHANHMAVLVTNNEKLQKHIYIYCCICTDIYSLCIYDYAVHYTVSDGKQ